MAKREALRELQSRLAERLQAARDKAIAVNWLAVEAAGRGFLFPLAEAGEIFTGRLGLMAVPHTSKWFMGVANLRGHLHGVVDLAGFLGLKSASALMTESQLREQSCAIAFNVSLETNCALLVDRLAGLRARDQMQREEVDQSAMPPFLGGVWRDAHGRAWHEISLASLSSNDAFLKIFD
jgi:twitching motility protein PilI